MLWGFNTQPPEGGWLNSTTQLLFSRLFQHTAARRRLAREWFNPTNFITVSTHSRPKAAGRPKMEAVLGLLVSTHSRPKAAGRDRNFCDVRKICFNTQPPEGSWVERLGKQKRKAVSTHSRLKAAGCIRLKQGFLPYRFNTQPPKGGWVGLATMRWRIS